MLAEGVSSWQLDDYQVIVIAAFCDIVIFWGVAVQFLIVHEFYEFILRIVTVLITSNISQ